MLPIRLPALRERLSDLEALVDALADDIARRSGLPHKGLTAEALALLEQHAWPGNIRELRNVLEQATLMTDDSLLTPHHFKGTVLGVALPGACAAPEPRATPIAPEPTLSVPKSAAPLKPLPQAVAELEAKSIHDALAATAGNKLAASKLLGISRATLYEKLVHYPQPPRAASVAATAGVAKP